MANDEYCYVVCSTWNLNQQEARMSEERTAENDATVCIAHGRFIPCRKDGEHRYTASPYWVKSVNDYQTSPIEGLTWEPAWSDDARVFPPSES